MLTNPQLINRGTPNGGNGDTAREGARKINENFEFLYERFAEKFTFAVNPNNISSILNQINNASTFEIKDPSSSLIRANKLSINIDESSTKIYKILNKQAGVFGNGQTPLTSSDLELIYFRNPTAGDVEDDPNTVVEDFGNLGSTELIDHINGLATSITIAPSGNPITILKAVVNSQTESYIYTGSGDDYGANDSQITASELELLEQESTLPNPVLKRYDEGNGVGYRLADSDPNNHGNIGKNAVDLSYSNAPSTINGATGDYSYAQGINTKASGFSSSAQGGDTEAKGYASHAEGLDTNATSEASHAEGKNTIASGYASHAEGESTEASGYASHAEGQRTIASGEYSHSEGLKNYARSEAEFSGGEYGTDYTPANDATDRLVNFGNGTSNSNRSDAFTIFKNGAVKFFKDKLSNIANAMAGMFILNTNDNNRPTIHNGADWKGLAYEDEIPLVTKNEILDLYSLVYQQKVTIDGGIFENDSCLKEYLNLIQ